MKFRKQRIAWSVTWGIVAVLLCFLWLRSFKSMDRLGGPISSTRIILIASINGHVLEAVSIDSSSCKFVGMKELGLMDCRRRNFDGRQSRTYGCTMVEG